VVRPDRHNHP